MKVNFKTFFFLSILSIMLIAAGSWIGGLQGAIVAFFVSLGIPDLQCGCRLGCLEYRDRVDTGLDHHHANAS